MYKYGEDLYLCLFVVVRDHSQLFPIVVDLVSNSSAVDIGLVASLFAPYLPALTYITCIRSSFRR